MYTLRRSEHELHCTRIEVGVSALHPYIHGYGSGVGFRQFLDVGMRGNRDSYTPTHTQPIRWRVLHQYDRHEHPTELAKNRQ